MDIAEEQLTEVAQMICDKFPEFRMCSIESIKEFIKIRAEELIEAS